MWTIAPNRLHRLGCSKQVILTLVYIILGTKASKTMFDNIVSSPRASLSSRKALELANIYLEGAFNSTDPDIAMVLCHDTEVSLTQAKKSVKNDKSPTVANGIATAYIGLGKLLESRGHISGAQASFKKAEKLG
jgi:hypothetical protein